MGIVDMIPSPWLGFLRLVFLANHLVSTDKFGLKKCYMKNDHKKLSATLACTLQCFDIVG